MSIKGQGYFLTLGKVLYIQKFKPDFLRNYFADLNQILMKAFQVLYVLCFTRPRYLVIVYRTTGPLVYIDSTNFKPLATICGCTARFVSDLVGNLEDRFSRE